MDKQKQIKEMVNDMFDYSRTFKIIQNAIGDEGFIRDYENALRGYATFLFNAGYRKIHENEVVLTQDELHERLNNVYDVGIESGKEVGSKVTAEKILNEIMSTKTEDENWSKNEPFVCFVNKVLDKCEELAEQFGVRI